MNDLTLQSINTKLNKTIEKVEKIENENNYQLLIDFLKFIENDNRDIKILRILYDRFFENNRYLTDQQIQWEFKDEKNNIVYILSDTTLTILYKNSNKKDILFTRMLFENQSILKKVLMWFDETIEKIANEDIESLRTVIY